MHARFLLCASLALAELACANPATANAEIHGGIGMGGYVSPVPGSATDGGLRSSLVLDGGADWNLLPSISVGLLEVGSFGGGDISLSSDDQASESIHTWSTLLVLTRNWRSERFRGSLGLSAGGGAFHLHDEIDHSGAVLSVSGWGPTGVLQTVWSGDLSPRASYRLRLSWVWARTDLPIEGNPGYRQKSDWSRLELTLGLGLGI